MDSLFRRRLEFVLPSTPDEVTAERRRRRQERKVAARQRPLPASDLVRGRFVALIEEDCLLFRVVLEDAPRSRAPAGSLVRHATHLGTIFRAAFAEIWDRIPLVDQVRLRSHWQNQDWPRLQPMSLAEKRLPRPLIEVVDGWEEEATETCGNYGGHLVFTAPMVTDTAQRLRAIIVRTLTQVHMYASREHYRLALELYEDPLAQWQKETGESMSDAWQEKSDALHDEYVRQHETAQAELRRRWRADDWPNEATK
jgi:hypothetical protein